LARNVCNQSRISAVKRIGAIASAICGAVAAVFLVGMLLLTVADVALRSLFNIPLRGVYELVELMLAGTFFIALPCVFLRDDNILVNTIDDLLPRIVPFLKRAALLLAVAVFVVLVWQGWYAARDSYEFHDVTADLALPRFWHWSLVLTGMSLAALAALFMLFRSDDKAAGTPPDPTEPRA
jgi:TRAP-type C4-dicarboxylate transport system permease small subunit